MYSYLKGGKGEEREIERCYKKVVSTISIFLKIEVLQSLHGRKIILTTFSIFLIHYMVVNVITDVILFVCLSVYLPLNRLATVYHGTEPVSGEV